MHNLIAHGSGRSAIIEITWVKLYTATATNSCYLVVICIGLWRMSKLHLDIKFVTRNPKLFEIHDDLFENMRFQSLHYTYMYERIKACREATSYIPLLWTMCVSEVSTIYLGNCSASWLLDLRSIIKVQLMKSCFSSKSTWISANLGFDVKL